MHQNGFQKMKYVDNDTTLGPSWLWEWCVFNYFISDYCLQNNAIVLS